MHRAIKYYSSSGNSNFKEAEVSNISIPYFPLFIYYVFSI